jgi:cell wall-associated NlpC family hydrolase
MRLMNPRSRRAGGAATPPIRAVVARSAGCVLAAMTLLPLASGARAGQPAAVTGIDRNAEQAPARALQSAQDLAIYALGLIGVDYRYGGSSPERGLDCSGLVRYVFQEVVGITLPRTSREMARLGGRVAPGDLQAGDLVFFNTRSSPFSHVGIYLGDHRFIHAPHRGGEVEIVAMTQHYWQQSYEGARRLVALSPDLNKAAHEEPATTPRPAGPAASADSFR